MLHLSSKVVNTADQAEAVVDRRMAAHLALQAHHTEAAVVAAAVAAAADMEISSASPSVIPVGTVTDTEGTFQFPGGFGILPALVTTKDSDSVSTVADSEVVVVADMEVAAVVVTAEAAADTNQLDLEQSLPSGQHDIDNHIQIEIRYSGWPLYSIIRSLINLLLSVSVSVAMPSSSSSCRWR